MIRFMVAQNFLFIITNSIFLCNEPIYPAAIFSEKMKGGSVTCIPYSAGRKQCVSM